MSKLVELMQLVVDQPCSEHAPPFSRWLNGTVRAVSQDAVKTEYLVRDDMTNSAGIIHGGVVSAIFDDLMGMLANIQGKEKLMVSVNLYIDFLSNARQGERVTATARVIRNGSRMVNLESDIRNAEGKLLATAKSNMALSNHRAMLTDIQ